ncbi:MAG: hypothetical protein JST16_13765 [Bdellovibrionales bacterium]|nr:hypothetical protein [Bdellovibrionales bacterium]
MQSRTALLTRGLTLLVLGACATARLDDKAPLNAAETDLIATIEKIQTTAPQCQKAYIDRTTALAKNIDPKTGRFRRAAQAQEALAHLERGYPKAGSKLGQDYAQKLIAREDKLRGSKVYRPLLSMYCPFLQRLTLGRALIESAAAHTPAYPSKAQVAGALLHYAQDDSTGVSYMQIQLQLAALNLGASKDILHATPAVTKRLLELTAKVKDGSQKMNDRIDHELGEGWQDKVAKGRQLSSTEAQHFLEASVAEAREAAAFRKELDHLLGDIRQFTPVK